MAGNTTKRLAVTISGAVSLGTYEAGVMYELLRALSAHNNDPETQANGDSIQIDVLTGASAGGMTAAILAQKLLFEADSLEPAEGNALYLPWVRDVDLIKLLNLGADERQDLSILSSNLVESISMRYLVGRYTVGATAPVTRHPASAQQISLGLAMSNLNGIDYGRQLSTGQDFVYTRFQDEFLREKIGRNPGAEDSRNFWEPVRNAAVACGAFPFAFRVKEVFRSSSEYPGAVGLPPTMGAYAYTDGGLFQNEPLGLAKDLVNRIDQHLQQDSRYYVYVAPRMRTSALDPNLGHSFIADDATFWNTGKQLVKALFQQARYHEWIQSEDINQRIQQLDRQALALKDAVQGGQVPPASLTPAAAALLPLLFPDPAARQAAQTRLAQQYATEYGDLVHVNGQGVADTWRDAVLVLETAAQLGDRDMMTIYAITASDSELAGEFLESFGGFFDRRFRQHDYDLGRLKARAFVASLNGAKGGLAPIRYSPTDTIALDTSLGQAQISDLSDSLRDKLGDQIKDRVGTLLEEAGMPFLVREAVMAQFVDGYVDKWLGR